MTITQNIFLPTLPTADDLLGLIKTAKKEYTNSKTSAMRSAANAFLVWYHGQSAEAVPAMRSWLDGEIDKANELIKLHNDGIEERRRKAKAYANGKMKETPSAKETAQYVADAALSSTAWAALKQVKIEGRDGASSFTRIVKFVFGFKKPSDASHVSRYAKALEFIELNKGELNGELTVDAIVELLKKVGGFEAAVEKMRGKSSISSDNVRGATLQKIKQVVSGIDTGDEISFSPKHEHDGYVFLVGRTTASGVMVCGELAINDNEEADALLLKIDGNVIGNPAPTVDFISRVVNIGQLVKVGRDSHLIDTAGTGKKFKVARGYSLLKNGASTHMVVSARYAEASLVVHAYPKSDVSIGSLEQGQCAMLDADTASALVEHFGDPARCHLMSVDVVQGDDNEPVSWAVSTDMGAEIERNNFTWRSMFGQPNLPLNMRGYDPGCTINLTHDQLRELYDAELSKWATAKADDKEAKKPISVSFDGITLTVGNPAFGNYSLPLMGKQGAHVSLNVRPRDLVDLVKKLLSLEVQNCALSGDNNGMLAISWEDTVGSYLVYIPAVDARGSFDKACIGFIKPTK